MSENKYKDIIALSRPKSKRPPMPISNRAAQFGAFAALTGYDDGIREVARLTEKRRELDEQAQDVLNRMMQIILRNIDQKPLVSIEYFVEDEYKQGGKYLYLTRRVIDVNYDEQYLYMEDGAVIPWMDIWEIEFPQEEF